MKIVTVHMFDSTAAEGHLCVAASSLTSDEIKEYNEIFVLYLFEGAMTILIH